MASACDWAHHESIGDGGLARDGFGERRQRDRGGATAAARILARGGVELGNTRVGRLGVSGRS
jgi:hypothetical protein